MPNRRIVVRAVGLGVAAAIAGTAAAAALTLHASGIDRHNAAHMGNPVRSQLSGWNCNGKGCAVRALQMNVVE